MPPIDSVTILRSCSVCAAEIETMTVKKDNMMLSSKALLWCDACGAERPERRDIVDRLETIARGAGILSSVRHGGAFRRPAGALI